MNVEETRTILSILRAAYPLAYEKKNAMELQAILNLWSDMFRDEPVGLVGTAVKALIATRTVGYPPTVGEVREHMSRFTDKPKQNESEAWATVAKACRNGLYGYEKEFNKFTPEIQEAVGCATQLREWAMLDPETLQSVVASNFKRTYRAAQERVKEDAKLPQDLKTMIAQMSDGFLLGAGDSS